MNHATHDDIIEQEWKRAQTNGPDTWLHHIAFIPIVKFCFQASQTG